MSIVIISASPKVGEKSVSEWLATTGGEIIKAGSSAVSFVNVRQSMSQKRTELDFALMMQADAIIFIFPLYFFCLPGILIRFLQDYGEYYLRQNENAAAARIYAIINCGFPEPGINEEAAGVIESFSSQTGNNFRFAVFIGGGGMILGAKDAPFMKKTMAAIKDGFGRILADTVSGSSRPLEDIHIKMNFPNRLYLFMGNFGWPSMAKRYDLKKKDLYKRPYRVGS